MGHVLFRNQDQVEFTLELMGLGVFHWHDTWPGNIRDNATLTYFVTKAYQHGRVICIGDQFHGWCAEGCEELYNPTHIVAEKVEGGWAWYGIPDWWLRYIRGEGGLYSEK